MKSEGSILNLILESVALISLLDYGLEIQEWSKLNKIDPGGLAAPPLVADRSEAGHCFRLLFLFSFLSTSSAFHPGIGID